MAWNISPSTVIFVPSFTYVASAEAVAQLGAVPFLLMYARRHSTCAPIAKAAIRECKSLGLRCEAVIAVDLFGQPASIDGCSTGQKLDGIGRCCQSLVPPVESGRSVV